MMSTSSALRRALTTIAFTLSSFSLFAQTDNVLVILVDDVGVDIVGAYGEGTAPPPTPNIDALAAGGLLFRNVWSNSVCSPTRACIQTGRYSLRTRVGHIAERSGTLLEREMTIPEVLDAGGSGYAHAAIGKWHLGGSFDPFHPNDAGWGHYAGIIHGGVLDYYAWARTVNGSSNLSTVYATTQMVDDALAWIGTQSGPWVMYLAFNAPHTPYHQPPSHLHTQDLTGLTPMTTPGPFHAAAVEALDTEIGRLLAQMGPAVVAQTNVIFIGDNGTEAVVSLPPFEPSHAKGSPYEGGINVPMIVSGPAVVSPGREVDALVGTVDIFSTVTELAGVDAAPFLPPTLESDSVSFVPYITDPSQTPLRTFVFSELFTGTLWSDVIGSGFAAIRDDTYKMIRFMGGADEMYDLVADPFETNDLLLGVLTAPEQAALTALQTEFDRLRSPGGAMNSFGTENCVGSNGVLSISGSGVPTIGGTYDVFLTNGAVSRPSILLVGVSEDVWGPLVLPFDMVLLGSGAGCVLHTSGEGQIAQMTSPTGDAAATIPLPYVLDFIGLRLFHSWVVDDPTAPNNRLGATVSGGFVAIVGI